MHRHHCRLRRVLELAVAATRTRNVPTITLKSLDEIAYLHSTSDGRPFDWLRSARPLRMPAPILNGLRRLFDHAVADVKLAQSVGEEDGDRTHIQSKHPDHAQGAQDAKA